MAKRDNDLLGVRVQCTPDDLAELMTVLRDRGLHNRIQITLDDTADDDDEPTDRPAIRHERSERAPMVPTVVYAFSRKRTARDIAGMSLPNQQRIVIAYVIKNGPSSAREIADGTGLKRKSVESAVYQLRHTRPALLVSQTAESD